MNELIYWGFSQYGGYYASVFIGEQHTGIHEDTFQALKKRLANLGLKADADKRLDH